MKFSTYKITHPALARFVQYILFNYSDDKSHTTIITSYANNNICLGIAKEKELTDSSIGIKKFHFRRGIHSYISGLYCVPHHFQINGVFDEICIDFTPLGYYHFFKEPLKTYILGEDLLYELWGMDGTTFFETIFETVDLRKRGPMIEQFLLSKLIIFENPFLQRCVHYIHNNDQFNLKSMAEVLQCSEKKISRAFQYHFDLTPKDYMKIVRFRKAMWQLQQTKTSFTKIAHDCGYYDQSHFIKDIKMFTEMSPGQLHQSLHSIEDSVLVSVRS